MRFIKLSLKTPRVEDQSINGGDTVNIESTNTNTEYKLLYQNNNLQCFSNQILREKMTGRKNESQKSLQTIVSSMKSFKKKNSMVDQITQIGLEEVSFSHINSSKHL